MKKEGEYVNYSLKIKRNIWNKFKENVPRCKDLNTAIVELIEKEICK